MKTELAHIKISKPAIRALQAIGIETLEQLTQYTEAELLALHGFGRKGLEILKRLLAEHGLSLKSS